MSESGGQADRCGGLPATSLLIGKSDNLSFRQSQNELLEASIEVNSIALYCYTDKVSTLYFSDFNRVTYVSITLCRDTVIVL